MSDSKKKGENYLDRDIKIKEEYLDDGNIGVKICLPSGLLEELKNEAKELNLDVIAYVQQQIIEMIKNKPL